VKEKQQKMHEIQSNQVINPIPKFEIRTDILLSQLSVKEKQQQQQQQQQIQPNQAINLIPTTNQGLIMMNNNEFHVYKQRILSDQS
jgi:hypothetical protein